MIYFYYNLNGRCYMKTRLLFTIIVMATMALVSANNVFAADEQAVTLKITGIEGKVLVKILPSTEWVDATLGMLLKKDDEIKTLADGKAHLMLDEKISIFLKPNSELVVEIPVVAEPYEEAGGAEREPVYAPANAPEGAASTI